MIPRPLRSRFEESLLAAAGDDGRTISIGDEKFRTEFRTIEVLEKMDPEAHQEYYRDWRNITWLEEQRDIVDKIRADESANKRFADLERCLSKNQVIPFVGSGLSVPSGYLTWSELLFDIQKKSTLSREKLKRLMAINYEEAAEAIVKAMPRSLLDEKFESAFAERASGMGRGSVQWLPLLFPDTIITTNYDPVLEYVYEDAGIKFERTLAGPEIEKFRRYKSQGERCLLKLHGDHRSPETRVLTKSEYDRAYATGSVAKNELESLLSHNAILFLGCSLNKDRTMVVLEELFKRDPLMPKHYAFLKMPVDKTDKRDREHRLAEKNIFPIWYKNDHDEALYALLSVLANNNGRV